MNNLLRLLSDFFNLFIRDADDLERLWPGGWQLLLYGGFVCLMFPALSRLG